MTLLTYLAPGLSVLFFVGLRLSSIVIASALVVFTPRNSILRYAAIPFYVSIAMWAYQLLFSPAMVDYIPAGWRSMFGGAIYLPVVWAIGVSCVRQWDSASVARDSGKTAPWEQFKWLIDLESNPRCVGTPYQPEKIRPWDPKRPDYVPTPREAILSKLKELAIAYLAQDILLTFFRNRIPLSLLWLVVTRYFLDTPPLLMGILSIAGGDDVRNWPPVFGFWKDAYTIRRFWGTFWHQNLRFSLSTISNGLCKDILKLKGLPQRYLNIFIVFALSGLLHVLADICGDVPYSQSHAFYYFTIHTLGIMVEDAVQALWKRWNGQNSDTAKSEPEQSPIWAKAVGFVWTFGFEYWVGQWYMKPYEDSFPQGRDIPFSIVKWALSKFKNSSYGVKEL